jgi:hypothetical protein
MTTLTNPQTPPTTTVPAAANGNAQPPAPEAAPQALPPVPTRLADYVQRTRAFAKKHPRTTFVAAAGAGVLVATEATAGVVMGVGAAVLQAGKIRPAWGQALRGRSDQLLSDARAHAEELLSDAKARGEKLFRRAH